MRAVSRKGIALATALVLALGALEGWYGRTDSGDVYGSDAVQYLDVARAFEHGDLHSALNPLWSQGYPALLAMARPFFRSGPDGDWYAIRSLNVAIFLFSWTCFVWLSRELTRDRRPDWFLLTGATAIFLTAQIYIDQVSRVGPDQLVAAMFFLVCALLLRMRRGVGLGLMLGFGAALGIGFLVKAIFLPLGLAVLLVAAMISWKRMLPAAAVFAVIVLGYGAMLSHAFGRPTLGESGSLNYAWHVNRLAKWVHWEGGIDPADKAWPKPWIANFTHWESDPPDFGAPLHASERVGTAPMLYVFHPPVAATYAPYFNPPYYYEGYRRIVRWRYQAVAIGKNIGDALHAVAVQPIFWALLLMLVLARRLRGWPVVLCSVIGIAIYLPVHLEGRYLSAFLAVLGLSTLLAWSESAVRSRVIVAVFLFAAVVGIAKDQRSIWSRATHHWTYRDNPEWRAGTAVRALGLPAGSEVAAIAWGANLHCDWAYIGEVRITSEIATAADERAFWALDPAAQSEVLGRIRETGATAVFTWDKPPGAAIGWRQLDGAPMWVYRF